MNRKPTPATGSLIERAAEAYDFGNILRGAQPKGDTPSKQPVEPVSPPPVYVPQAVSSEVALIDRHHLRECGFIVPGAPPSALSEEFRLVKRQILVAALGNAGNAPVRDGRLVLVCSAQPNEGKTFCSVNLALSMASETDVEVLLVDADVAKPEILSTLGLAGGAGLMDALAEPSIDVEKLIIKTDVEGLSVLPAGRQTNNDTELLASGRTHALIQVLLAKNPRRIVLFDTAPALAASPASALAMHVGQVLLVVRADQTGESELREAIGLIDSCPHIQLMLNGVSFSGSNRKFGSYYGFGE